MSKDLEVLKADVEKLMLKDWTKAEVTKLDEFMEDVIIATMTVIKLPIHIVVGQNEQLVCSCGSTKINTTIKNKPFCFLCGEYL